MITSSAFFDYIICWYIRVCRIQRGTPAGIVREEEKRKGIGEDSSGNWTKWRSQITTTHPLDEPLEMHYVVMTSHGFAPWRVGQLGNHIESLYCFALDRLACDIRVSVASTSAAEFNSAVKISQVIFTRIPLLRYRHIGNEPQRNLTDC